jgi:hypothetical protein
MEIRSDQIADFDEYFAWIRAGVPATQTKSGRIRFT